MSDHSAERLPVITVFLADDNLLVREGVRALIDRQSRPADRRRRFGLRRDRGRRHRRGPQRPRHRHPHAAVVQPRRHRRREGGAQAPPRHRHRDPLAVRRPRVRRRAARRRLGRLRLSLEGQPRPGQPTDRGDPHGRDRRHRPRPVDRRVADAPGHVEQRALGLRRVTARLRRRGQADQGHRRRAPH